MLCAKLSGMHLAYWIAKAECLHFHVEGDEVYFCGKPYRPHEDAAIAEPLFDAEGITFQEPLPDDNPPLWTAWNYGEDTCCFGETRLIAGLRLFCVLAYGRTVSENGSTYLQGQDGAQGSEPVDGLA